MRLFYRKKMLENRHFLIGIFQHFTTVADRDFFLIPPELPHRVGARTKLTYFCFHFDIDDPNIKVQLIQNINFKYQYESDLNKQISIHLQKLDSLVSLKHFDFNSKMIIQIELSKILQIFYNQSIKTSSSTPSSNIEYSRLIADDIKNKLTDQILMYVKNTSLPERGYTVKQAIDSVNLSSGYGSHIFKETYGISPREYLTKLKINEAKKLLLKLNFSIDDISLALGYTSVSNFSRQFKRWTKTSPLKYRNRNRKNSH
ncbi:helix-turn-helix domain-containing protein [Secundilactobacillus hailunensis]|uniref:Helix-turn-helix domain-containing protein n=2 Tax=Secundilactobacillus hailunensis TaxID=2559923 RepID=A0ABW1T5I2_9LACO